MPWLGIVPTRTFGGLTLAPLDQPALGEHRKEDDRCDGNDEACEHVVVCRRQGKGEATVKTGSVRMCQRKNIGYAILTGSHWQHRRL